MKRNRPRIDAPTAEEATGEMPAVRRVPTRAGRRVDRAARQRRRLRQRVALGLVAGVLAALAIGGALGIGPGDEGSPSTSVAGLTTLRATSTAPTTTRATTTCTFYPVPDFQEP